MREVEAQKTVHTVGWRSRINDFDQKKILIKKETHISWTSEE